jgi:hypothetical protein
MIYAGYGSGDVKAWQFAEFAPTSSTTLSPAEIRVLSYSIRHDFLIAGPSSTYENESGQLIQIKDN